MYLQMHIFALIINVSSDFGPKGRKGLLSLISLGIEFQRNDPSYIKPFFKLLVRGCGKQRVLETFRRL